jgi:hypothetical protein
LKHGADGFDHFGNLRIKGFIATTTTFTHKTLLLSFRNFQFMSRKRKPAL